VSGRLVVYTLHFWPKLRHAGHYTGSSTEQRLPWRLTDHALGRGARITQVQAERGGSWVLANVEPGGRGRERQLKQHGATRRCDVCKAVKNYQAGKLTAPEALARAGWDRSTEHERGLLLGIFGLPKAPENMPASPAAGPRPGKPVPQPGSGEVRQVPKPRPAPRSQHITPDIVAAVDQLQATWDAQTAPQPAAGMAELEAGT
jgi:hypothetical protein